MRCYGAREIRGPVGRTGKGTASKDDQGWEEFCQAIARARILLKIGEDWSAPKVAQALDVAESSVFRIKRRFAEDGLDGVLQDRPQAHRYRKLDDRGEAHLIALAAAQPPKATTTGICACWRTGWWSWGWSSPCPTRRCACT